MFWRIATRLVESKLRRQIELVFELPEKCGDTEWDPARGAASANALVT